MQESGVGEERRGSQAWTPGQTMPGMSLVGSWESDVFTTAGDVGGTARAHWAEGRKWTRALPLHYGF